MTGQRNKDNGLQTRWTKGLLITAVWRNGGGGGNINSSASNKHLCLVDSEVLLKPYAKPQTVSGNYMDTPKLTEQ